MIKTKTVNTKDGEAIFKIETETLRTRVNQALNNALPTHITKAKNSVFENNTNVCDAMRYSVLDAGKRIRPILVYATAKGFNAPLENCDAAACAVELIHCGSLIHDDLPAMDDDDLRRGKPTCHIAFDEATAILAGDALQALAYELIACDAHHLNPTQMIDIIKVLADAAGTQGIIGGQIFDIEAPKYQLNEQDITVLHCLKTESLISAAVKLGLITANVTDQHTIRCFELFAEKMGLAFQIHDDILDIEATTKQLGKPQGSDLKNNKATYPNVTNIDHAKKVALNLCNSALSVIHSFDDKFDLLRHIASLIVERIN